MISVVIMLIVILLASCALGIISKRKTEECIPLTMMGTIVCLYIFYCLNLLIIGRFLIYVVFFAMILFAVTKIASRKVAAKENPYAPASDSVIQDNQAITARGFLFEKLFTSGTVLFLGLSVLFIIYANHLKPAVWDELRLWAAMPKALHFTEAMQVGEGSLLFTTMQSYPPGMALLVYFFTALSGTFSYGSIFAVCWIFMAALIIPAAKQLKWKQWYMLPLILFFAVVIPIVLTVNGNGPSGDWNFFFVSLYIDPILGCLMGYAFYQAINNPTRHGFDMISFSITLFVLPTLKNMGAIYACVAFVMAVVIMLVMQKNGSGWGRKILYTVIPLIAIAISYFSWQWIINRRGTGEFIDMQLSSFTGTKLVNVLKGMASWGHIPFVYYVLFFILFGLFMTFILKDIPKKAALIGAAGFVVAFLIFFYGYTSHYGLMLSSIHRYTSTFTFAAFIYFMLRFFARMNPKAEYSFRGKLIDDNYQEYQEDHEADEGELKEIAETEQKWADAGLVLHEQLKNESGQPVQSEVKATGRESDMSESSNKEMTRAEARAISKSVIVNILPSKPVNSGRLMFIEALIILAAVLLLFNSRNYQLKNDSMNEAAQMIPKLETMVQQGQDAAVLNPSGTTNLPAIGQNPETAIMIKDAGVKQYSVKHPAKCYLALGGDTRKQSQRHETYALEAIGSKLNIQNIWCDKLFNEAEDGVVTSQREMTRIWAQNLLKGGYEYVLIIDPDADILYAINEIESSALPFLQENYFVLRVVPNGGEYGITFVKP